MQRKFWSWLKDEDGRTLYFDEVDDKITPKQFKSELLDAVAILQSGLIPQGGDVFSASQIYNMLMDIRASHCKD